jgi:hypothetical protein
MKRHQRLIVTLAVVVPILTFAFLLYQAGGAMDEAASILARRAQALGD